MIRKAHATRCGVGADAKTDPVCHVCGECDGLRSTADHLDRDGFVRQRSFAHSSRLVRSPTATSPPCR